MFDVAMGSYMGAEICDLIWLYIRNIMVDKCMAVTAVTVWPFRKTNPVVTKKESPKIYGKYLKTKDSGLP